MNDAVPRRQAMRHELETTRTAFHALLAEIPPRAWTWPTANPAWTIGQTMVHITTFLQYLPSDVALIRRGWPLTPPAFLFNWLNPWLTRWVARNQTPGAVAARYDHHHRRVLELLATISTEEWERSGRHLFLGGEQSGGRRSIATLFHNNRLHFQEHAAQVRAALQAGPAEK